MLAYSMQSAHSPALSAPCPRIFHLGIRPVFKFKIQTTVGEFVCPWAKIFQAVERSKGFCFIYGGVLVPVLDHFVLKKPGHGSELLEY